MLTEKKGFWLRVVGPKMMVSIQCRDQGLVVFRASHFAILSRELTTIALSVFRHLVRLSWLRILVVRILEFRPVYYNGGQGALGLAFSLFRRVMV